MKQTLTIGYDGKRAVRNITGLGNYSRYVLGAMSGLYPDMRLVVYAPDYREGSRADGLLAQENVRLHLPQSGFMRRAGALWRSVEMVHEWLPEGVDLYHGLSNEIPLTSTVAPVPTVVTIHDLIWRKVPGDYSPIDHRLYEWKYGRSAKIATRVIAISERTKADIIDAWGIPADKIDVIYQGFDPAFSQNVDYERKLAVRERYGLPGRYIITVGTVQSRKNQLLAVKALGLLPEDVVLVIVGKAEKRYGAEIKRYISENGLESRVKWLVNVPFDDLPALYATAELSSYTSRYEGFGLPVVESLASGTPVVACTGSCLEEAGGQGAIYVDPVDVDAFAKAANDLLAKPYLRDAMVGKGKKHIAKFNAMDFARKTLATYNRAIIDYHS